MQNNLNETAQPMQPQTAQQGNEMSVKDLFYLCLSKWKWFLLSLVVCLSVAVVYLLRTPKSYTQQTSVLIKEDAKGKSINSDMAQAFSDMGLSAPRTNVYNELLTLQSNDVALSVVKRLALNVNYYADGAFHQDCLYGTTLPVKVDFPAVPDETTLSFDIDLGNNDSFTLSNFKKNGEKVEGTVSGTLGYKMLHTPVGRMVVKSNKGKGSVTERRTIHVARTPVEAAKKTFVARFKANVSDKNATIIDMTYSDVSQQRGVDVLKTVIAVYNDNWIQDRNLISVSTSRFINERLIVIEKELGNVDSNISTYKSANRITDIAQANAMYMQRSTDADVQVLELNNQVYMAQYIRDYLINKKNNFQLLPANTGLKSANINSQISEYNNVILQRNNIVANSSERNPIAVELDDRLSSMRAAIITSVNNEILALNNSISSQRSFSGDATSKIASSPNQAKHLLSVERQQKVKESLYLFLLQKREENELSQAFTAYNTRVISAPHGNNVPSAPVSRNILLIAIVLGLGIPFAILYLREMMNTTVRGKSDLVGVVSIPYLGEIPQYWRNVPVSKLKFWKKQHEAKPIVVKNGNRGLLNEAFRIVATNLEFMSGSDKGSIVYMVTSYNAGSGKSFIAANLSAITSIRNKKVILIDGDLRHTTTSRLVPEAEQGLSDYLSGCVSDYHGLIRTIEAGNGVSILPVGTVPPNPIELLSSPKFGMLIESLRKEFDVIIIDCPPANMMADAAIIGKYVDKTIFVVCAGLFERKLLGQLEDDYKEGKFKNASLILNDTSCSHSSYGYAYGYGYGSANDEE